MIVVDGVHQRVGPRGARVVRGRREGDAEQARGPEQQPGPGGAKRDPRGDPHARGCRQDGRGRDRREGRGATHAEHDPQLPRQRGQDEARERWPDEHRADDGRMRGRQSRAHRANDEHHRRGERRPEERERGPRQRRGRHDGERPRLQRDPGQQRHRRDPSQQRRAARPGDPRAQQEQRGQALLADPIAHRLRGDGRDRARHEPDHGEPCERGHDGDDHGRAQPREHAAHRDEPATPGHDGGREGRGEREDAERQRVARVVVDEERPRVEVDVVVRRDGRQHAAVAQVAREPQDRVAQLLHRARVRVGQGVGGLVVALEAVDAREVEAGVPRREPRAEVGPVGHAPVDLLGQGRRGHARRDPRERLDQLGAVLAGLEHEPGAAVAAAVDVDDHAHVA